MNYILLTSILIRFVAIAWSIYLLRKLRDWRVVFLTILFALMASRQLFTLYSDFHGWYLTVAGHLDEIPGLIVSIFSLIMAIFIEKIIENQRSKDKSLIEKSKLLQLYKDYFNATTSGIFVFDDSGLLVDINDSACKMQGYSREEMLAMHPKEYIHPDSHHVFNKFMEVVRQGQVFHGTAQGIHKEGYLFDVEITGLPVMINSKQYYFSSLIDITEKINAEKALRDSEEKYRSIVETTDEWIWEIDTEGRNTYSNNTILKILGYESREVIGKQAFLFMHPDEVNKIKEMLKRSINNKKGWNGLVVAWKHKDGSDRYLESNAIPVFDENKKLRGFRGADRDVTERREIYEKLRLSEERYRTLYDDNPSMFFTIDVKGNILSVNNFGAEQLGYSGDQLIGQSITILFYKEDKDKILQYLENCLIKPDDIHRWELRKVRNDGTMIWVRETARVVYDNNKNPNIFIVCEDFSDTHLLSEQLTYQASHDALTGLINRREFELRLNRVIDTSRTQKTEHVLCYLDLDQFKVINDACGHIAGDELLRQVAHVLQRRIRKRDTLARLGGDEFGILMEHCNIEQAYDVANEILKDIGQYRFNWNEEALSIGVSIGLVPVNETILNKTEVLREADAACYAAKEAGRNRIHQYSADDTELARRRGETQWVARLNRALENNYFVLYAQPVFAIKNKGKKINHYEILIRLKEGNNGEIISPGTFLPAAERYNLITRIDKWVINTIFDFLNSHDDVLSDINMLAINLSGKSLADDVFLEYIIEQLKDSEHLAQKICFEITETAVITNLIRASLFMRKLKAVGCRFSLDDFGSGLSSFAYLKTLPVDYLKIDGMFVKDIIDDETDYAMVKSINDIGQVMGIETIAEFVENDQIKQKLVEIGVNYVQGYGVGMPEPFENIF